MPWSIIVLLAAVHVDPVAVQQVITVLALVALVLRRDGE
jgi:hypothetical protein